MILRRFMQHVREQNWFAVGLDVIVVIVGIFLGLQVQAAYEERQARAEEEEYLTRIDQELSQSIELNQSVSNIADLVIGRLNTIMDSIEACEIIPGNDEQVATGLYNLANTLPATYLHSVIDELNSSGNFKIIENTDLRDAFTNYQRFFTTGEEVATQMRNRVGSHVSFIEKQLVYRLKDGDTVFRNFSRDEINFNFDKFCNTDGNLEAISAIKTYRQVIGYRAANAVTRQSELQAMVRTELERFK